ncbi:MAG: inositol monophosphatase family protein [Zoogloeaceae bacterium]|jgi:myo-inositol-1(or 4)-monophosphatase|nr:inositol monophosphatase family protein [Zoogloeaceae bacterium]
MPDLHPPRLAVERILKDTAEREILPRFLKVNGEMKADGSAFSAADIAAQESLIRALARLADLPMIGEEMPMKTQEAAWAQGFAEGVWVMDPIDGSTNFLTGLPQFAVSVALMRQGRPVLGVSYLPLMREMFSASLGGGVWLNGEKLPPIPADAAHKAVADTVACIDFKRLPPQLSLAIVHDAPIYSQRNFGSSVLDWCYLAAGRVDAITHGSERLWDYAAGWLMTEEMGGCVTTFETDDFAAASPWKRSIIAARDPELFRLWRDWLRQQMAEIRTR